MEKWAENYTTTTSNYKRISQYTGLNFNEIDNLSFEKYLLYNRDSWIDSFTHDETGLNFLKDLWRLQQTESDDSAIEEFKERRN
ncbi:MAG: hypothetical protein GX309_08545 [Clostridiales bacterium]|nr:hypothetical protein [Clostridiales bacterium]